MRVMNLLIPAAVLLILVLFAALVACVEAGYRVGRRRIEANPDVVAGAGVVEASVFGLLGLLLAFQFSAGQGRLASRRELIVKEANAIGTAYLRLDLLPAPSQPPLRELFRRYTDLRVAAFDALPDVREYERKQADAAGVQGEIWSAAVSAAQADPGPATRTLVLPALNDLIDVTTERSTATATHAPAEIVLLLVAVSLVAAVLAGHAMAVRRRGRSALHELAFAGVIAGTLWVMADLEFPRFGLIRDSGADRAIRDTRAGMQ
jgi:hypothetical protein